MALPALRTVRADLPHTALQSVASSSGLASQSVGRGHREEAQLSEEGVRPAAMVTQRAAGPRASLLLASQRAQPAPDERVHVAEDSRVGVLEVAAGSSPR